MHDVFVVALHEHIIHRDERNKHKITIILWMFLYFLILCNYYTDQLLLHIYRAITHTQLMNVLHNIFPWLGDILKFHYFAASIHVFQRAQVKTGDDTMKSSKNQVKSLPNSKNLNVKHKIQGER